MSGDNKPAIDKITALVDGIGYDVRILYHGREYKAYLHVDNYTKLWVATIVYDNMCYGNVIGNNSFDGACIAACDRIERLALDNGHLWETLTPEFPIPVNKDASIEQYEEMGKNISDLVRGGYTVSYDRELHNILYLIKEDNEKYSTVACIYLENGACNALIEVSIDEIDDAKEKLKRCVLNPVIPEDEPEYADGICADV